MMRTVMTMALAVMMLAGCDRALFDDQIRSAVRDTLKDPDSAQWGEKVVTNDFACIIVNAKGGAGGYTGKEAVFLQKSFGGWSVVPTKESFCASHVLEGMSKKAAADRAVSEKVEKTVLAKLKANGFIPPPDPKNKDSLSLPAINGFGIKDKECNEFVDELLTAGRIAGDTSYESRDHFARKFADGLAKLDAKVCKKSAA